MFSEANIEKLKRPHVTIVFGANGHEDEYDIRFLPNGLGAIKEVDIPDGWESIFEQKLEKGWHVMNRGGRLEVKPPRVGNDILTSKRERTEETDRAIRNILKSLVGEGYEFLFSQ